MLASFPQHPRNSHFTGYPFPQHSHTMMLAENNQLSHSPSQEEQGSFINFDTQAGSAPRPRGGKMAHAASTTTVVQPPKRFQFIDNTSLNSGSNNSTQVRRHVMQEFMRQKRWNSSKQQPSSSGKGTTNARRPVQKIRAQKRSTHQQTSAGPISQLHRPSTPKSPPFVASPNASTQTTHSSPRNTATRTPSSSPSPHLLPRTFRHSSPVPPGAQISLANAAATSVAPSSSRTLPIPVATRPVNTRSLTPPFTPEVARLASPPLEKKRHPNECTPRIIVDEQIEEISRTSIPGIVGSVSESGQRQELQSRVSRAFFILGGESFNRYSDRLVPSPERSLASHEEQKPLLNISALTFSEPQSILGASRADPFDTLPMRLSKQDEGLFDFYVNVMPACLYGLESRSPQALNWYKTVFVPEAMKSAVAFQNAVLAHAANMQALVQGKMETPLSIEHRSRASAMLYEHFLEDPSDTSDSSIFATLAAAALEDFDPRLERKKICWTHFRAAQKKIRDRGGPSALTENPRMGMLVNWSDYMMMGFQSEGSGFFFDDSNARPGPDSVYLDGVAHKEIRDALDELLQFLRCSESLALVQANFARTGLGSQRAPLRYDSFSERAPLRRLLSDPLAPRYGDSSLGAYKQILSRMAAILTINAANWQYRHSVELGEKFLREIGDAVSINELEKSLSAEALCQILLTGSGNPALEDTERPWLVGRMLKVAKRLSRKNWDRLSEILLSFLVLDKDLQPCVGEWEAEVRDEVLGRPATEYVMPALQEQGMSMKEEPTERP